MKRKKITSSTEWKMRFIEHLWNDKELERVYKQYIIAQIEYNYLLRKLLDVKGFEVKVR